MDKTKFDLVKKKLIDKKMTVSFAESCTGGLLSALFVAESGVSSVYQGSIVAYSNDVKMSTLNVPESEIIKYGAVSEVVALSMAKGAQYCLKSDWGVSITGIAGPTGGTDQKPIGTVCFGLVGPGFEKSIMQVFEGCRSEVQRASVNFAIDWLSTNLI